MDINLSFNMDNKSRELLDKAMIVLCRTMLAYQAPEVRAEYALAMVYSSPANWPADVCFHLLQADANYWNEYLSLPPPPPLPPSAPTTTR